jgi:hypothetical protein
MGLMAVAGVRAGRFRTWDFRGRGLTVARLPGRVGASYGSQRAQICLDPTRHLQNVTAGGQLLVRLPQTKPDTGFVPGGQGVAGSNPAVPTVVRALQTEISN